MQGRGALLFSYASGFHFLCHKPAVHNSLPTFQLLSVSQLSQGSGGQSLPWGRSSSDFFSEEDDDVEAVDIIELLLDGRCPQGKTMMSK